MTITLERLVEVARAKVAVDRETLPAEDLLVRIRQSGALDRRPGRLVSALRRDGMAVIAEIKGASPVTGQLRAGYDNATIARQYEAAGAAAISVLTEETYFGGSLDALEQDVEAVQIPVLRKDFIVEPYQIQQAALAGASAVLLIADVLPATDLRELVAVAHEYRLDAMVEVHRRDSIAAASAAGSGLIGVNNRNLDTMTVDWRYALEVASALPADAVRVAESGISAPGQLTELVAAGYDAALVGSSLMAAADPGQALRVLLQEVGP